MKRIYKNTLTTLIMLLCITSAFAIPIQVPDGGTGQKYLTPGTFLVGNGINGIATSTFSIIDAIFGTITATNTSATSTFNTKLKVNATSTLATTTSPYFNNTIFVDGSSYAMTSAGVQNAINDCYKAGCKYVEIATGTVDMISPIRPATGTDILCKGTRLTIQQSNLANFSFNYMFSGSNPDVTIRGCNLDGGYRSFTAPPSSRGGGITLSRNWRVLNNTFRNFNYFPVWVGTTASSSLIEGNVFTEGGNGNDNIGGGGGKGVQIRKNYFSSSITGNVWDNVGGQDFIFEGNIVDADRSIYIEGMKNITITNNFMNGGGTIAIQSNTGYFPDTLYNSNNVNITNNDLKNGGAIFLKLGASTTLPTVQVASSYIIANNRIASSSWSGILVYGSSADVTQWGRGIVITGNVITSPNQTNTTSWNTGNGIVHPSGINISQGRDVVVTNNIIVDYQATPTMQYGIEIGQAFSPATTSLPDNVYVAGNTIYNPLLGNVNKLNSQYFKVTVIDGNEVTTDINNPFTFSSNLFVNSRLGVGTSSPDSGASFNNYTGSAVVHIGDDTTNTSKIRLLVENRWTGTGGYGLIVRKNVSTPQFLVDGTGFVGIATSSPGTLFSVEGILNFSSTLSMFYNALKVLGITNLATTTATSFTASSTSIDNNLTVSGTSTIATSTQASSTIRTLFTTSTTTFGSGLIQLGGSAYAGKAMCYATGGVFGHCTGAVGGAGDCTCVAN